MIRETASAFKKWISVNDSARIRLTLAALCAFGATASAPAENGIGDGGSASAPVFTKNIAPIFQKHCQECHRPGEIAPMSLIGYEDVRPWAKSIREKVSERTMPPWHATAGIKQYANDRSLNDEEIAVISRWVEAGAQKGEDSDMPPPVKFNDGWKLGQPDRIIGMSEPYVVAAEGVDEYRCFVLDAGLAEDRWVTAVEIQPGNRQMDHHIVLYVDKTGNVAPKRDAADPAPGYECFGGPGFQATQLGGWGPGGTPKVFPKAVGHLIPAGGKIVMQMHYHRTGKQQPDQTLVGLHFSREPIQKALRDGLAINFKIALPPGDANYIAEAERAVNEDITVHSVAPHMHLLGKKADMWAELPDGGRIDLVQVPRWDFNWQTEYEFKEPIRLPKGSKVKIKTVFDNSAENPFQPVKPPKLVTFGEQTTDEMCVGVFFYTKDAEQLAGM